MQNMHIPSSTLRPVSVARMDIFYFLTCPVKTSDSLTCPLGLQIADTGRYLHINSMSLNNEPLQDW